MIRGRLVTSVFLLVLATLLVSGCVKVEEEPKKIPTEEVTEVQAPYQIKAGILEQDEVWSGKILIVDRVEVPEGVTLTIKPGTKIMFKHYRHGYTEPDRRLELDIDGKLIAIGTPEEPIWFTSDAEKPMNGDWGKIHFSGVEDSIIKYAIVEFTHGNAISMWSSSPTISHTIIRWGNGEGIYLESYSSPTIEYCMIYQNANNGIAAEQFNNLIVRYNFIAKNGQSGIHLMASNATIEHNVIVKNTNGISLMDGSFAKVRYNTIKGNKLTGIWLETGAPGAEVVANTIVNNSRAVGGLEFYPLVLNFNNLQNLEMEIDIEEEAVGEIDATNNWWGTEDENLIVGKINDPAGIVTYSPLAEEITEHKEEITSTIQFDYEDLRPYELGYTPGDQARDKFLWVLPDDNTRRIVKRLSHGEEFPWSLTWVKGELWMANNLGVFRIDPETGEMTRAFNRPGLRPWGMTFDGTNLWINDFTGLRIYEVSLDGEVLSSFSYAELFPKGLNGMAWDGEYLYLTGWVEYLGLIKFDRAGNFIERINMNQFIGGGLTFDGEHFWAQGCNGKIYKIDKNGNVLGWISSGSTTTMFDLAWDGQYLWSGERTNEMWDDEKIFKLEILQVMR